MEEDENRTQTKNLILRWHWGSSTAVLNRWNLLKMGSNEMSYLERYVSRCEIRRTHAKGGCGVSGACITCCIFGSDFRHISPSSLQSDAPLALGHHHPFTATHKRSTAVNPPFQLGYYECRLCKSLCEETRKKMQKVDNELLTCTFLRLL